MSGKKRPEIWSYISWGFIALFALILVYPMFGILKQSVFNEEGVFTWSNSRVLLPEILLRHHHQQL